MESEGIFYFFIHTTGTRTLVLADDSSAFTALPGIDTIRYNQTGRSWETINVMTEGKVEQNLVPVKVSADDFNLLIPSTDLFSVSQGSGGGTFSSALSLYRYPGLFTAKNDGEKSTGAHLSSCETEQLQLRGRSMCRAFHSGCKFTLTGHVRTDANTKYILRSITHHLENDTDTYNSHFVAFPATTTFRPPQTTSRATIRGSQTAIVIGKSGEEIWTDQYGRVKVKFHWDHLPHRMRPAPVGFESPRDGQANSGEAPLFLASGRMAIQIAPHHYWLRLQRSADNALCTA
jgi:type VI secretion system secreted protein VgrG